MSAIDAQLKKHAVKQVLCYNPESLSVLKRFSRSGARFESITRLYAEMLKKKPAKKLKMPAVTYQDPCHLGRYAREYVAPRQVIAGLGLSLKEMWRSGYNSLCCGAGGGLLVYGSCARQTICCQPLGGGTGNRCPGAWLPPARSATATWEQGKPKGFSVVDLTSLMAEAFGYKGKEVAR